MKSRVLISQGFYFFIAGVSAVSLDYVVYKMTLGLAGLVLSKVFGFYSGVVVSFLINSSYTFRRKGKSFLNPTYFYRYIIFITVGMVINVLTNYFILKSFSAISNITLLAFLVATFTSMVFNFLSMKLVVFK